MALKEKTSVHLGVPYVYFPDKKKFLCQNGVLFTLEEYKNGIDISAEYERRRNEDQLYDYSYAKSTGLLRKKRSTANENIHKEPAQEVPAKTDSTEEQKESDAVVPARREASDISDTRTEEETSGREGKGAEGFHRGEGLRIQNDNGRRTVTLICLLLLFTTLISGYISTLHTATYLYDYVDVLSSWLMSASVTAYNATAFEVAVIFKSKRRFGLTFVFIMLWGMVTLFSMATTVSVFYDRFNFTETQIAEENRQADSNKLALELLRTKEKALREDIAFKKQDIQYRQERDYATTAVRKELNELQAQLQENLTEQEKLLKETPEVTQAEVKQKESLFGFLGRLLHIEGGVMEFIMSTLSAVFVNLIAPLSLTAVTELLKKKA